MVLPSSRCSVLNSRWISRRVIGSNAPNGSSSRINGGSAANARATPTRCRWPPESSRGMRAANRSASRPTIFNSTRARSRICSARPAFEPRHHADIFFDGQMREQTDFLNHVTDAPAQPNRIPFERAFALDPNLARRRIDETVDQFHRRGLARAAAPEKNQSLAAPDGQIETGEKRFTVRDNEADVSKLDDDLVVAHRHNFLPPPSQGESFSFIVSLVMKQANCNRHDLCRRPSRRAGAPTNRASGPSAERSSIRFPHCRS